jgi:hypothetical protein
VSPDEDFSPTGSISGIQYFESFKKYKEMLTDQPDSPVFKRIFSKFNTALFGTTPSASDKFVADDGDYNSELEQFRAELLEEEEVDALSEPPIVPECPVLPEPLILPTTTAPQLPAQAESQISISVTSQVLTNFVGASQVSNIVGSNVNLPPPESERVSPLPSPIVADQPAQKKKGARSKKASTAVSEHNAAQDVSPAPSNGTKKGKAATPANPPTRTLRNRG